MGMNHVSMWGRVGTIHWPYAKGGGGVGCKNGLLANCFLCDCCLDLLISLFSSFFSSPAPFVIQICFRFLRLCLWVFSKFVYSLPLPRVIMAPKRKSRII